jgi:hypothetical protein
MTLKTRPLARNSPISLPPSMRGFWRSSYFATKASIGAYTAILPKALLACHAARVFTIRFAKLVSVAVLWECARNIGAYVRPGFGPPICDHVSV